MTFESSTGLLANLRTEARGTGSSSRQKTTKGTGKHDKTKRNHVTTRLVLKTSSAGCILSGTLLLQARSARMQHRHTAQACSACTHCKHTLQHASQVGALFFLRGAGSKGRRRHASRRQKDSQQRQHKQLTQAKEKERKKYSGPFMLKQPGRRNLQKSR